MQGMAFSSEVHTEAHRTTKAFYIAVRPGQLLEPPISISTFHSPCTYNKFVLETSYNPMIPPPNFKQLYGFTLALYTYPRAQIAVQ